MIDLVSKASTLACICFYAIEVATDGILATDSAGNKRYVLMYLDDGTIKQSVRRKPILWRSINGSHIVARPSANLKELAGASVRNLRLANRMNREV
jgi:hypothetical protein